MPNVAIIIAGVLRSFSKHLWPFLKELPDNFDVYISAPRFDDDRFYNPVTNMDELLTNKRIKGVFLDSHAPPHLAPHLTQRERNTVMQWYRIQKLFNNIPKTYDFYVRCRPDIKFECAIEQFLALFQTPPPPNSILIPKGFDIFDPSFVPPDILPFCINDQFAIGSYAAMTHYCNFYSYIDMSTPLISEKQLFSYLQPFTIERINLTYRLILSECFSIALCGDSGAGKSHISNLLNTILPFDNNLLIETDRYHKWERGAEEYNTFTHLHPEANNLEKMSTDAYKLSLGSDVFTVDYDHSTGKFTEPEKLESSKFMIFCGLHTLFKESMRAVTDLKIFIDTQEELKTYWKLQRDTTKRGATKEKVLQTIAKRKDDYDAYVEPQKEYADLIVSYKMKRPEDYEDLLLEIQVAKHFSHIEEKLKHFAASIQTKGNFNIFTFSIPPTKNYFAIHLKPISHVMKDLKEGFDGIIQYTLLCLLWKF